MVVALASQDAGVAVKGWSWAPIIGPWIALPVRWLQRLCVSRSYMSSELRASFPDTPKVSTLPFTVLAYTMPVKQRGHQVTARCWPPISSSTISCALSVASGYARASPLTATPMTSSSGRMSDACAAER